MKVSIIIPCYNEEETVCDIIKRIDRLNLEKRIIAIDDGSLDNTYLKIKKTFKNVFLLRHKINLGKGAALKTGCEAALKLGTDIIVFIDADGQHSPEIIPEFIKKVEEKNLDIVFGERKINRKKMPLLLYLGNKILTKIVSYLSGVSLQDTQTGFIAFISSVYQKIVWQSSGYAVESDIISNVGKNKLKYGVIPIDVIYKDIYKGTTLLDGLKIFFNILKQKII